MPHPFKLCHVTIANRIGERWVERHHYILRDKDWRKTYDPSVRANVNTPENDGDMIVSWRYMEEVGIDVDSPLPAEIAA